ncbi:aspartate/methionine/tyrosine aminotransferase [Halanaerobium saccharolyticum]|uniref:Aminotransferase n=1 Tax=Halanaerobium saccharolyticum TaxID=43595 RepID=A0A4R7YXX1_9FIRM|nr:aminotransferase [Halanaerobium saccharolyticum]RAK12722.1 aspartate/methionine/tyrosine aminotransferase [Halanaerobium saccharolyticum]TDW02935.1 aspartate/methionine/tyrosine aminotransferase [Halanaerobium saccharolyticum]TDX62881.1 aspartate/methionine/tyrosine aminotransferase [Halanaerobium saccharolyticum]
MKIAPFKVEEWMNEYEMDAEYNIAETCVESLTVEELLNFSDDPAARLEEIKKLQLTYGDIKGSKEFKAGVSSLYESVKPENILPSHGAIGANFLLLYSLVEAGDEVVSVFPTYQQLYSIPESFGAEVKKLDLKYEDGFLPDLEKLKSLVNQKTKLIAINNPNNPSGVVMKREILEEIVEIARAADAYILADEVYRGFNLEAEIPSIADLYEKGISVGSMSKVFSLAGLRMGWIAGPEEIIELCQLHRDYTTISNGMISDYLSTIALENKDKIIKRNLAKVKKQLQILDDWVQSQELIEYVKPNGGTTAFLKYRLDLDSESFAKKLFKEKGVLVVPGTAFGREGFLRIGFAGSEPVLKKGLALLEEFLEENNNGKKF